MLLWGWGAEWKALEGPEHSSCLWQSDQPRVVPGEGVHEALGKVFQQNEGAAKIRNCNKTWPQKEK